jgi:hypothetical protein
MYTDKDEYFILEYKIQMCEKQLVIIQNRLVIWRIIEKENCKVMKLRGRI